MENTFTYFVWGTGTPQFAIIRNAENTEDAQIVARKKSGVSFTWAVELLATPEEIEEATREDDHVLGYTGG